MYAIAGQRRFAVAQVGPDFMIVTESVQLPPIAVELVAEIDGQIKRRSVYLPNGVQTGVVRTPIEAA